MSRSEPPSLVADCDRCFALCCVLLPFAAVSGFGIDKPGGTPCPNLAGDDRCTIHATLRRDGWHGCATFDPAHPLVEIAFLSLQTCKFCQAMAERRLCVDDLRR